MEKYTENYRDMDDLGEFGLRSLLPRRRFMLQKNSISREFIVIRKY